MLRSIISLVLITAVISASANGAAPRGPRGARKGNALHRRTADESSKGQKGQKGPKKKKGPQKRDCELVAKENEVKFKCKAKTDGGVVESGDIEIKDQIEFKVNTKTTGLKVEVKYDEKITLDSEAESKTQYGISFDRIIEYEKADANANGSPAYDWKDDKIVQEMDLSEWQGFSDITDDEEGVVSRFSVTSPNEMVRFVFAISREDKNDRLTANKMKIDFELRNFPWLQSNTYVALVSSIATINRKIKPEEVGGGLADVKISFEDDVDTIGFTPFGEYTWDDTANSTNTTTGETSTIEVVATSPLDNSEGEQVAFSFVGDAARSSDNIYWDPEAGVGYEYSNDESAGLRAIVSSLAGALALVSALLM